MLSMASSILNLFPAIFLHTGQASLATSTSTFSNPMSLNDLRL
ncbi:MAG: hypothetical protein A4E30_00849 [Methanomassiliicoccales archaeon PtaB.Bin215]|nr:MAG: hypothetical protein A4E30_00849 [Methanomassiliicoccales archaeon PtaB.Bin215]